jgi:D-glycero-alpha-D-manno-heptose-7-phosphate kinase
VTGWVRAAAPTRVADAGGWTDTWFAGHGRVCHVAVWPGAQVQVRVGDDGTPGVAVHAAVDGARFTVGPAAPPPPDRHRLLAAAVEEAELPAGLGLDVFVSADMPPGCATGTSAAVVVALLAALDRVAGRVRPPAELAAAAHRVETERLGLQSGVQDQLAAAHGGINDVRVEWPAATVRPIPVAEDVRWEVERRLVLVFLGRAHHSSAVHEQVIASLAGAGAGGRERLDALRHCAAEAAEALEAGDVERWARALSANTDAQAGLHPALVADEAREVWELAAAHGATGWKINGAGGDGGSVTVVCGPDLADRHRFVEAVSVAGRPWRVVPVRLARDGARVWSHPPAATRSSG